MNEEVCKYLTEAMGNCWHTWSGDRKPFSVKVSGTTRRLDHHKCTKCGVSIFYSGMSAHATNSTFTTWSDFGRLFTWAKEQRWWIDFILDQKPGVISFCELLTPEELPNRVYKFLRKIK